MTTLLIVGGIVIGLLALFGGPLASRLKTAFTWATAKSSDASPGTFEDFKRLQLRAIELGDFEAQQELDGLMPALFGCQAVSGKPKPKPPVVGA